MAANRGTLSPVILGLLLGATTAGAQDVAGSKDHQLITRYPASTISQYDVRDYDEFDIPLGRAEGDRFAKVQRLAGKTTTVNYQNPDNRSVLEVFRNYEQALQRARFETLFTCADQTCGTGGNVDQLRVWPWSPGYGQRHLTAKLARAEGDVYVSLHVQAQNPNQSQTFITIVEAKPMEAGLVTVDAAALANEIARTGHAAVYGIFFDTGKDVLKPESEPALVEVAKLLQQNAALRLHVVGHTDNVGELAYNMELSRRRANAVVRTLVSKHGVAAARLRADGVGPLVPVASNRTEEGRAKNRRVDLVEM